MLKIIIKKTIKWLVKKTYLEGEYLGESLLENSISDRHGQSVVYRIGVVKRAGERLSCLAMKLKKVREIEVAGSQLKVLIFTRRLELRKSKEKN